MRGWGFSITVTCTLFLIHIPSAQYRMHIKQYNLRLRGNHQKSPDLAILFGRSKTKNKNKKFSQRKISCFVLITYDRAGLRSLVESTLQPQSRCLSFASSSDKFQTLCDDQPKGINTFDSSSCYRFYNQIYNTYRFFSTYERVMS